MKTKIYFSVFLIAFTLFSCNKNNNEEQQTASITSINLAKGATTPVLDNGNYVIENSTNWNSLLSMFSNGVIIDNVFSETNIDFSQFMVIAVIDEGHTTGGWSIDITNISETSTNIEVTYSNLDNGDDTLIAIQPFHVVKIPKSNKPVIFIQN